MENTLQQCAPGGLRGMTRGPCRVRLAKTAKPGETLVYATGGVFQIAPRQAALCVDMTVASASAIDFVGGTDIIVFDDLENMGDQPAMPLTRNQESTHPQTGVPMTLMMFRPRGGFIPLGARQADGKPHPHAGTGFGLLYMQGLPAGGEDRDGRWQHRHDVYRGLELLQYAYDGHAFCVTRRDRFEFTDLLPGATLTNPALNNAIPDGDDLLLAMEGAAYRCEYPGMPWGQYGCGVARWRRGPDGWRPVAFMPVTEAGKLRGAEPTLVRDSDGSLLFSIRQTGADVLDKFGLFLWRSADGGTSWERILHVPNVRPATPVSLNMAINGTPFFAGNMLIANGTSGLVNARAALALWALSPDRTSLVKPMLSVRFPQLEFGPPPTAHGWTIDHPTAENIQLRDGCWRTLLGCRIMAAAENSYGLPPTPHSGFYLEEVLCDNSAKIVPWEF